MRAGAEKHGLAELLLRMTAMLPEEYQAPSKEVRPVSMGSAGLKYDSEGKVAWDTIWASFCDLAMAGGPPHKGSLLEAGSPDDITTYPESYDRVVAEICRGTTMVTSMRAVPSVRPGWIRVECATVGMAGWLLRSIVMENISCRCEGRFVELPAGPHYRLEKEVKNVITVIAKTSHYWTEHMSPANRRSVSNLLSTLDVQDPLYEPATCNAGAKDANEQMLADRIGQAILRDTGLGTSEVRYGGWLGINLWDLRSAIWVMRALVASNVLSRREGVTVFIPINPMGDPDGERIVRITTQILGFASAQFPIH